MSVYVDPITEYPAAMIKPAASRHGVRWCHLAADSDEELTVFAAALGLPAAWRQRPGGRLDHFDLTPTKRAEAVRRGAVEVSTRQVAAILLGRDARANLAAVEVDG